MRGGHNKTPIVWDGVDFSSFSELDKYLGKSKGYCNAMWRNGYSVDGLPIMRLDVPMRTKIHSDADMLAFYGYVNARRNELPDIGLKNMLNDFKNQ